MKPNSFKLNSLGFRGSDWTLHNRANYLKLWKINEIFCQFLTCKFVLLVKGGQSCLRVAERRYLVKWCSFWHWQIACTSALVDLPVSAHWSGGTRALTSDDWWRRALSALGHSQSADSAGAKIALLIRMIFSWRDEKENATRNFSF